MKVLVVDDEQDMKTLFEQRFRKEIRDKKIDFAFANSLRTGAQAWVNDQTPYRLSSTSNTFIQRMLEGAYGQTQGFIFSPYQAPGYRN